MSPDAIVSLWKDASARAALNAGERAELPPHPSGPSPFDGDAVIEEIATFTLRECTYQCSLLMVPCAWQAHQGTR